MSLKANVCKICILQHPTRIPTRMWSDSESESDYFRVGNTKINKIQYFGDVHHQPPTLAPRTLHTAREWSYYTSRRLGLTYLAQDFDSPEIFPQRDDLILK